MLKAICALSLAALPMVIGSPKALAQTVAAQQAAQDVPGICQLYNRSGYLVVDETGNLVDIVDYCERQRNLSEPYGTLFWQVFEATADREALAAATALGTEEVVAYGVTICPFFQQGGSMEELRQIQTDGDLPSGFEVAVTVAAINAYCPDYRSEIGR